MASPVSRKSVCVIETQQDDVSTEADGVEPCGGGATNVTAALAALEANVKRNASLFQSHKIHKVASSLDVTKHTSGGTAGGGGGELTPQELQALMQQEESSRRRHVALKQFRRQVRSKRRAQNDGDDGDDGEDEDGDDHVNPFLAAATDHTFANATVSLADPDAVAQLLAQFQGQFTRTSSSVASARHASSRRHGDDGPCAIISEAVIAKRAASEFESMMVASLGDPSPASSLQSPHRHSRHAQLRHPSLVPPQQYVKAQLDALRFSMDNGFHYHEHFDLHVSSVAEQRRQLLALKPSRRLCAVNFILDNRNQVHYATPLTLLAAATREMDVKHQRDTADAAEMREWIRTQLDMRREFAEEQKRRALKKALAARRKRESTVSDVGADPQPEEDTGPLAALQGGGAFTSEREIANAVQTFWLALVAHGVRGCVFAAAAEKIFVIRRENAEQDLKRHRLNTENMNALNALDTMKRKHEKCRTIIKTYVQLRMREKHHGAVDLILRALRHRQRALRTIQQIKWYRRCVVTVQRQVRVFLQSIAARKMLLHLAWVRKECELLQVPNTAIDGVRQQWQEQQRMFDIMRNSATRTAPTAAAAAASSAPTKAMSGQSAMPSRQLPQDAHNCIAAAITASAAASSSAVIPIRKPGGPHFYLWSTKVAFVPPGGVPLDYRSQQINFSCHTLVKTFVSSLLSADANRKFFVKQKARYDTDGLDTLGLPRPKLPLPPIHQLFMKPMTLHLKVRLALKEKGGQAVGQRGSGVALKQQPPLAPKGSSVSVTRGATSAPNTSADDALEAPSALASSPLIGSPATAKGSGTSAECESPKQKLPAVRGAVASGSGTSLRNAARVVITVVDKTQAEGQPATTSPRRPSLVRVSENVPDSPRAPRPPPLESVDTPSRRRSVIEHFDEVASGLNEALPTTVRSDAEYAQMILGKSNAKALRSFIDSRPMAPLLHHASAVAQNSLDGDVDAQQLPMHLGALHQHYEHEAIKRFEESYHMGPSATVGVSPRRLEQPAAHSHSARGPQRPPRVRAAVAPAPSTSARYAPSDPVIQAHRPVAPGHITRRQHEERLKFGMEANGDPPLDAVLAKHLEAPFGTVPVRDVPKLFAMSGSSSTQRNLMVLGGSRAYGAPMSVRPHVQLRSDDHDISAVALLTSVEETRARASQRVRALKFT